MVMAGTIKRFLPFLVKGIENRARRKEKDKKENRKEKKRKLRKGELVQ